MSINLSTTFSYCTSQYSQNLQSSLINPQLNRNSTCLQYTPFYQCSSTQAASWLIKLNNATKRASAADQHLVSPNHRRSQDLPCGGLYFYLKSW